MGGDYWDASALVEALQSDSTRDRLESSKGFTRVHALAETFSTLTGGRLGFRCRPDEASEMVCELAQSLQVVELTESDVLRALSKCHGLGIRGGLVHDFLHASAAEKSGAERILTLNLRDFKSLGCRLKIELP